MDKNFVNLKTIILRYFPSVVRRVHPDLFTEASHQKDTNLCSLQELNNLIGDLRKEKCLPQPNVLPRKSFSLRFFWIHPDSGEKSLEPVEQKFIFSDSDAHIPKYGLDLHYPSLHQWISFVRSYLELCRKIGVDVAWTDLDYLNFSVARGEIRLPPFNGGSSQANVRSRPLVKPFRRATPHWDIHNIRSLFAHHAKSDFLSDSRYFRSGRR